MTGINTKMKNFQARGKGRDFCGEAISQFEAFLSFSFLFLSFSFFLLCISLFFYT